jgi:hypothetical protein
MYRVAQDLLIGGQSTLRRHVEDVLRGLESRVELFEDLLRSYPDRLEAVKKANSRHNDY